MFATKKERHVKVLPELARCAYAMGLGSTFVVYTTLRFLDKKGTGYVEREYGLRALSKFGIGRKKIYRAVKAQERLGITLFTIHPTKITYTKQTTVAAQLGATRAVQPRGIPESALGSISDFYAHAFAAWISAVGDKNGGLRMSREKLSQAWNIGATQQRAWERKAGILVQANVATFQTPAEDDESAEAKRLTANLPRDREHTARCWQDAANTFYQLPNTYVTPFAVAFPWGATRKAAKAARHANESAQPVGNLATGKKQFQRVFFQQDWLNANPWVESVTASSLLETGKTITTTRVRRHPGTGTLEKYPTHFAVWNVSYSRPMRRGGKQI